MTYKDRAMIKIINVVNKKTQMYIKIFVNIIRKNECKAWFFLTVIIIWRSLYIDKSYTEKIIQYNKQDVLISNLLQWYNNI